TLTALSSELQGVPRRDETTTEAVLRRALGLRGVHGSALFLNDTGIADDGRGPAGAPTGGGRVVRGLGLSALWPVERPPRSALASAERACRTGVPVAANDPAGGGEGASWTHAYTAALPILRDDEVVGALVVVGEARDPFTVLDNQFLLAFGQQVGASLA